MMKHISWKVVGIDDNNQIVAEYVSAIEQQAQIFCRGLIDQGYNAICFQVEI